MHKKFGFCFCWQSRDRYYAVARYMAGVILFQHLVCYGICNPLPVTAADMIVQCRPSSMNGQRLQRAA